MVTASLIVTLTIAASLVGLAAHQDMRPCDEEGAMNVTGQGLTQVPVPDPDSCNEFGPILKLILAENSIGTLSTRSLENYTNLYFLDLSSCEMRWINPQAFARAHVLRELDISCNPLTALVDQPFEFLHLETLHIRKSGLVWIEAEVFAHGFKRLERLDLSNNKLTMLPEGIFTNTINVVSLDLSHNRIKSLDPGLFAKMANIAVIELNHNDMTSIHRGLFDGLAHLRRVDLSNNPLAVGPVVLAFSSAPLVSLDSCNLTSLPLLTSNSTVARNEAIRMDIWDNPIECDCSYIDGSIPNGEEWRVTCYDGQGEKTLLCLPAEDTSTTTRTPMTSTKDQEAELRPTDGTERVVRPTCITADGTNSVLVFVIAGLGALVVMLMAVIVFMYVKGRKRYQSKKNQYGRRWGWSVTADHIDTYIESYHD